MLSVVPQGTPSHRAKRDASPLSWGNGTLEEHAKVSNYNIVARIKILVSECLEP